VTFDRLDVVAPDVQYRVGRVLIRRAYNSRKAAQENRLFSLFISPSMLRLIRCRVEGSFRSSAEPRPAGSADLGATFAFAVLAGLAASYLLAFGFARFDSPW
jgi:hypothetical protein